MIDKNIVKKRNLSTLDRRKDTRRATIPRITYPEALPITAKKNDIVDSIKRHRVVVITGETGSGKTTQIPKMCLEAGRGIFGIIGCTQPRRVAAITVAHRIAEELGEELGRSVGYQIRFEDRTGKHNYIKIMTDGILLNEAQNDPYLHRYDTIIVDEAHERSLNIDFVLGILRTLLKKRKDLKVIITSATIDTEKFSRAFHAPIIEVSGRMYPVEVRYRPVFSQLEASGEITYVDSAVTTVKKIMESRYGGDTLIFMPTEQDIRDTCELIEAKLDYEATVLPLFARLPWTEQRRVFLPSSSRKIVVATNVAETSITIPGIRYVIDTGLARISQYNPRSRTTSLPVRAISKSSADQRKGRCGRVQNGICIRLFDKADYEDRPLFTEPEILRSNLAEVILRMLSLNLGDISLFPFIDSPHPKNIRDGIEILKELGAIEPGNQDNDVADAKQYTLTTRGKIMARLPMDPRISRMIIEGEKKGCVEEILVIAAALSIQDPRERPVEYEKEADKIHTAFVNPSSDFLTLLRIWDQYHGMMRTVKSKNRMKKFCREHYLSFRRMREWIDVYDQLKEILNEQGWKMKNKKDTDDKNLYEGIHKSILSGYLSNIATKKEKNIYAAAKGKEVMIFPGSGLFSKGGSWIVAAEMIETSRLFARMAANIKMEWLEKLGGDLCRSVYSEPHWSRDRGEVTANEQVSLFGLVIVPGRPVSYGRINPEEASDIFIRSALVEGDLKKPFPFLIHNQEVIERVLNMEDKIRRRNLLADEHELAMFYQKRLAGIYDVQTLHKLIREKGDDAFLRMKEDDILQRKLENEELSLYPDEVHLDEHRFPCAYRFAPGTAEDGTTLKVPIHMVSALTATSTDWVIPGLLREKVAALLKGLPKEYKKKLPPLAHTCNAIMSEMLEGEGSLLSALSKMINAKFGVDIPVSLWAPDALAEHLQVRFSVIDAQGKEVAASRDLCELRNGIIAEAESTAFNKARLLCEKTGLTDWDFGKLPAKITLESRGFFEGYAYPGLEAGEGCVNIRVFKNRHDADASHKRGVMALYAIRFKDELKYLRKAIAFTGSAKILADTFGGAKQVEIMILAKVEHNLFWRNIRTQEAFIDHAEKIAGQILPTGQAVLKKCTPLLRAYYDTVSAMHNTGNNNRFNKPVQQYLSQLRQELSLLMPHDFLIQYNDERLNHMPRYLKALAMRAERGVVHLGKALAKENEIKIFSVKLQDMVKSASKGISEEKLNAIEHYRWMIEEYKVSVFAQELKTAIPVSPKRLEMKIQEIERIS
jgi:ATP-dependent helicase HrpA